MSIYIGAAANAAPVGVVDQYATAALHLQTNVCTCLVHAILTHILWLRLQFSSHKIYPLLHDSLSAQSASILSFEFESADGKNICCTSAQPHGFKAKKVCGQLLSNQYLQSLSMLLDIPLKIMSTPTDYAFTFPTPDKHLQPASLAEITAQLVSGQLQVFFRYVWLACMMPGCVSVISYYMYSQNPIRQAHSLEPLQSPACQCACHD